MDDALKRNEAARQLRAARICLLVVTLLEFAMGMAYLYAMEMPTGLADAPPEYRRPVLIFMFVFLGVFGTLWLLSRRWPKICLILALVLFWGIQLVAAAGDSSQLYRGILIKLIFTVLLIKGIQAASRGEALHKELDKVFE